MSLLRVEEETLATAQSDLRSGASGLNESVASLDSAINGLVGSGWTGYAAQSAQTTYSQWSARMKATISILPQASDAVGEAARLYEEADQKVASTWSL